MFNTHLCACPCIRENPPTQHQQERVNQIFEAANAGALPPLYIQIGNTFNEVSRELGDVTGEVGGYVTFTNKSTRVRFDKNNRVEAIQLLYFNLPVTAFPPATLPTNFNPNVPDSPVVRSYKFPVGSFFTKYVLHVYQISDEATRATLARAQ